MSILHQVVRTWAEKRKRRTSLRRRLKRYLGLRVEQLEPREVPAAPDLIVSGFSISTTSVVGGNGKSVAATWTVTNQGDAPALGRWADQVYISDTATIGTGSTVAITAGAEYQSGLPAGASYTVTRDVPIGNISGNKFLIVRANDGYQSTLAESNKSNNDSTGKSLTVTPASGIDLVVSATSVPATLPRGNGQQAALSWTVTNQGTTTAVASWNDAVYLSPTATYNSATAVTVESASMPSTWLPLAPGASYTRNALVSLDNFTAAPYLLFVTNSNNAVAESNATNNVKAVAVTFSPAPSVDLVVSNVSVTPATGTQGNGDQVIVKYTVTNAGSSAAVPSYDWTDRISFSNSATDSTGSTSGSTLSRTAPLAAGASYTVERLVTIPPTSAGNRFVLVETDAYSRFADTNRGNNLGSAAITLLAPAVDLAVVSVSGAPTSVMVGNNVSFNLTYTVKNQGTTAAQGQWTDTIYLSDSPTFDSSTAQSLNSSNSGSTSLPAGGSYSKTLTVTIANTLPGNRYLFVRTGASSYSGGQFDSNSSNDVSAAIPITLTSPAVNLVISDVMAPTTAEAGNGATISVSSKVTNTGSAAAQASWSDQVYISTQPTYSATSGATLLSDATYVNNYRSGLAAGASYTLARTLNVPSLPAGNYYLHFVTDSDYYYYSGLPGQQSESYRGDNVISRPITITAPAVDLVISAVPAPPPVVLGTAFDLTYTRKNQGTADAKATWSDTVYLSQFPTYDPNEVTQVTTISTNGQVLAAGATQSVTKSITLPQFATGNQYLIVVANNGGTQSETTRANNWFAVPISISAPDLVVSNLTVASSAVLGDTIAVTYTVTNQGSVAVTGSWTDTLSLSDSPTADSYDSYTDQLTTVYQNIQTLAAGASYTVTKNVTLPSGRTGNRYFVVKANAYSNLGESDVNNNSRAQAIALTAPDLTITAANAPSAAVVGDSIAISFTVKNNGTVSALANWDDAVYLSANPWVDSSAVYLKQFSPGATPLTAGASYTTSDTVTLASFPAGAAYLVFVTDVSEDQGETNKRNNSFALPITLTGADLVVTAVTPSATTITVGQSITVNYTVKNQGTVRTMVPTSSSSWTDGAYIGSRPVYDYSASYAGTGSGAAEILPGQSWTGSMTITIPSSPIGASYLFIRADLYSSQAETDESNNWFGVPITVVAPDLAVLNPSAPSTVVSGNGQSVSVSYTVKNVSTTVSAVSPWTSAVYISDSPTYDSSATFLDSYYQSTGLPLAPGASLVVNRTFTMPVTKTGSRYLIFRADAYNNTGDPNTSDNTISLPITVTQPAVDLTVTGTGTVPSTLVAGQSISLSYTVQNQGTASAAGSWYDAIVLSPTATYNSSTAQPLSSFISPATNPLAAGASYTKTTTLTVPGGALGSQYLLFITNRDNGQGETNSGNNVFAVPVTVLAPDLTVTTASAPSTALLNQSVSVSWTVKNQGTVPANSSWYDAVYLSNTPTFDNTGTYITTVYEGSRSPLAANGTYTQTQSITIPNVAEGNWYLHFIADYYSYQGETDETNNSFSVPITLTAPNADLVVTSVTAPSTAGTGSNITLDYTVKNQGILAASGTWQDRVYLSTNNTYDGGDLFLLSIDAPPTSPLAVNGSYSFSKTLSIPDVPGGNYYLLVITNPDKAQQESDYTNGTYAIPITLQAADLTITGVTGAPSSAILGQSVSLAMTVKNIGAATATRTWTDAVYLSATNAVDGTSVLVSARSASNLAVGNSYTTTFSAALPSFAAGSKYLVIVTNVGGAQAESSQSNNTFAIPITLTGPDLASTSASGPSAAPAGSTITVDWSSKNVGSAATLGTASWYDAIYLSTSKTLSGAQLLSGKTQSRPNLAIGDTYSDSMAVTIPSGTTKGSYYLVVSPNYAGDLAETDRTNNLAAIPIEIGTTDLILDPITAPSAAQFGQTVAVSWTVRNIGDLAVNQTWNDRVYLSPTATFNSSTATLLASVSSSDVVPLASGGSYSRTANVIIPLGAISAAGNYYLFVFNDDGRVVGDDNRANNQQSQALALTLPPLPDLAPTNPSLAGTGFTGKSILIGWTESNIGTLGTTTTWTDRVSIAQNSDGSGVVSVFTFTSPSSLTAGQSVSRSVPITLPATAGTYYVVIEEDVDRVIQQGPFITNDRIVSGPIVVSPSPVTDLVVTAVVPPSSGVISGQQVSVSFTVKNIGTAATSVPIWRDYVLISQDPDITFNGSNDQLINNQPFRPVVIENPSYLNPGETYSQSATFTIPVTFSGPFYAYVVTNGLGSHFTPASQLEGDRGNNLLRSGPFNISLAPPPDLATSNVRGADQGFSGQTYTVNWTVTNTGTGVTDATSWEDRVFLSPTPTYDVSTAKFLGRLDHSGKLASGEGYRGALSVTLPDGISGDYYVLVRSDFNRDVFENGATDNNLAASALFHVNLTPPPDLAVTALQTTPSGTALAGNQLTVTYTTTNEGSTITPNGIWTNEIYLSPTSTFNTSTAVLLSQVKRVGALAAAAAVTETANVTLPYGIDGSYTLFVFVDTTQANFELDRSNNSRSLALTAQNRPADLVVTTASISSPVAAGGTATMSWTVRNQGTGPTEVGTWVDKVYASTDATLGTNRTFVGAFRRSGSLAAGQSYSSSSLINIPLSLSGAVNFFVVTDAVQVPGEDPANPTTGANGVVLESNETNNVSAAVPTTIARQLSDLQVTALTAPSTGVTGAGLNISWTVTNAGTVTTNVNSWNDDVYLTPGATFDPSTAIYLGSVMRANPLDAGQNYSVTVTMALPVDLAAGTYRVVVRTDRPDGTGIPYARDLNRVYESNESNNTRVSTPVTVTAATTPDLQVSAITIPASAFSGGSLTVGWTVTNHGVATLGGWTDMVYLGTDQIFDSRTARALGSFDRVNPLAAGANYTASATFDLPVGLTGSYYVFVRTDVQNRIYERDLTGRLGVSTSMVSLVLPPAIDLVAGTITVPANAVPGLPMSFDYTVTNNTTTASTSDWYDSFYLSKDNTWDATDPFLLRVRHAGGIAANGSYTQTILTRLPGIDPGQYKVILRTNVRGNVPETSLSNNLSASLTATTIDVPALTLGTAATGSFSAGQPIYYKFTATAGQTIRINLTGTATLASEQGLVDNQLYLRYGAVPSTAEFDLRGETPLSANQQILIPVAEDGTYYVLLNPGSVPVGGSTYSVTASVINFSVTGVSPGEVGNAGPVTLAIEGAKFDYDTRFELVSSTGSVVVMTALSLDSSARAYATFDLTGRAPGSYDLRAVKSGSSPVTLTGAVSVVAGVGGRISARLSGPDVVLVKRTTPFELIWSNPGDADAPGALLIIHSPTDTPFAKDPIMPPTGRNLFVFGAASDGPAGVLRPGTSYHLPLYFVAPSTPVPYDFQLQVVTVNDPSIIDWDQVLSWVVPERKTLSNWSAIFAQVKAQIGTTWGDFVRMLGRNANVLPAEFGDPTGMAYLLDLEVRKAMAAITTSIAGKARAVGLDMPLGGFMIYAENSTNGQVYATRLLNDGSFTFDSLTAGSYTFSFERVLASSTSSIAVVAGQHVVGVNLDFTAGATITGSVNALPGNLPVGGATVRAIRAEGGSYVTNTDSRGVYRLEGLPAGTYTLIAEAPGLARTFLSGLAVTTGKLQRTLSMAPEGTITATNVLTSGGPIGNDLHIVARPTGAASDPLTTYSITTLSAAVSLGGLPAGSYTVTFSIDGYLPVTRSVVVVTAGQANALGTINFDRAGSIAGRVTSNDPAITTASTSVALYQGTTITAVVFTDPAGNYLFTNVAPGAYTVGLARSASVLETRPAVTVVAGSVITGANVTVVRGGTIGGAATNETTGAPLVAVTVYAAASDGTVTSVITDSNGRYSFTGLTTGAYTVYLPISSTNSRKAVTVTTLDGTLVPADLSSPFTGTLTGRTLDAAGQPLAGVTVQLRTQDQTIDSMTTGPDGTYSFYIIDPGTFDLRAIGASGMLTPVTGLAVGAGQTVTRDLSAGSSTVRITVTDGANSLAGTVVGLVLQTANGSFGVGLAQVDANGVVTFANQLPGNYLVEVTGPNNRGARMTFTVGAGTTSQTVPLTQQGSLTGVITGPGGVPIPNASIIIVSTIDGNITGSAMADTNGIYSIKNVIPGTYEVRVLADSYHVLVVPSVTVGSTTATQNVSLTASTTIFNVTVKTPAGHAVAGAVVAVLDSQGRLLGNGKTATDGTVSIRSAFGSGLIVRVVAQGYLSATINPVTITSGTSTNLPTVTIQPVSLADPTNFPDVKQAVVKQFQWIDKLIELGNKIKDLIENKSPSERDVPEIPECIHGLESMRANVIRQIQFRDAKADAMNEQAILLLQEQAKLLTTVIKESLVLAGTVSGIVGGLVLMEASVTGFVVANDIAMTETAMVGIASQSQWNYLFTFLGAFSSFTPMINSALYGFINGIGNTNSAGSGESVKMSLAEQVNAAFTVQGVVNSIVGLFNSVIDNPLSRAAMGWQGAVIQTILLVLNNGINSPVDSAYASSNALLDSVLEIELDLKQSEQEYDRLQKKVEDSLSAYERALAQAQKDENCPPEPPPPPPNPILIPNLLPYLPFSPFFPIWPLLPPVFQFDPNDIIGPEGTGPERFVGPTQSLGYQILFENKAEATAPAQKVVITQTLDGDLDARSFRLGEFGFGSHRFTVPDNVAFYQTRLDLRSDLGIFVDVTATIDIVSKKARWTFVSIDPTTGEAPLDPLKGFLPPEDGNDLGQGFVSYRIKASPNAATGARIDAMATIVFDQEAPIDTPSIFNTIDAAAPTTAVSTMPTIVSGVKIPVSWDRGSDNTRGSAVTAYNVYVSKDSGPQTIILERTTLTSTIYTGEAGHKYTFTAVAIDNAGNEQPLASATPITTRTANVIASTTPVPGTARALVNFSGPVARFTAINNTGPATEFTATIDWGDNTSSAGTVSADPSGGYVVSGTHLYSAAGSYTVTVSIRNGVGVSVPQTTTIDVAISSTNTTIALPPSAATIGQPYTLTAYVAAPGLTPTGRVTFLDGTLELGIADLVTGTATFTLPSLAAGDHNFVAVYAGTGAFSPSRSGVGAVTAVAAVVPPTVVPPPPTSPQVPPVSPPTTSPGLIGTPQFAVGADAGGSPIVRYYNADGSLRFSQTVFTSNFTGGVRTTVADFNNDGVPDVVVGTGPGIATRVRILDGKSGSELFAIDPFESSFTGGVFVASGDLNGDGLPELIISPDEGGGPRVRVFSGAGFTQLADFFGIDDSNFRGGARAAVGDLNGDGVADLLISAGFGGGPRVAGFDGKSIGKDRTRLFADFFVFEQSLRNGVYLAVGDIDGDGKADLVAGGGPGGGPRVLALSGSDLLNNKVTPLANFFAGDQSKRGGVRLAVKDLDGDAKGDILVGPGTGSGSKVLVYLGKTLSPNTSPTADRELDTFPDFTGGVFVG